MTFSNILLYAISFFGVFSIPSYSKTLFVLLLCVCFFLARDKRKMQVIFIMTFVGYASEVLLVARGLWVYPYADVLSIPYWIGLVWGIGSSSAIDLYTFLEYDKKRTSK